MPAILFFLYLTGTAVCVMLTLLLLTVALVGIVLASVCGVAAALRRTAFDANPGRPRRASVAALRAFFLEPANVAGRTLDDIVAEIGPWHSGGTMDWGISEYYWRRRRLLVIVEARNDRVTQVSVRDPDVPGAAAAVVWSAPSDAPHGDGEA